MTGNEDLQGALSLGESICWDETHGYIMGADMNPDTDCSGFICYCLSQNGFNIYRRLDTSGMITALPAYGFQDIIYIDESTTPTVHGDILCYDEGAGENGHCFFVVENTRGYTSLNDPTIINIPKARVEASSDRGNPQTGDQANSDGVHGEVWVHPYSPPSSGHTWHIFRWPDGPTPPGPAFDKAFLLKKRRLKYHQVDFYKKS